jgi:REP element-mobilizing transposase RayT
MWHLAQYFVVAIDAFVIMSNHFHLVVFFKKWGQSDR